MENNFEDINDKYSEEDINFFNALAEKYDLEQNADQLIIVREDNSRVFLPKSYQVSTKHAKIDIEDLIKENL